MRQGGITLSFTDGSIRHTSVPAVAGLRVTRYSQPHDGCHTADTLTFFGDDIEILGALIESISARLCTTPEAAAVVHRWPTAVHIAAADAAGLTWLALAIDTGSQTQLGVAVVGTPDETDSRPRVVKRPPANTQIRVACDPT